jgi:hypothetical protein
MKTRHGQIYLARHSDRAAFNDSGHGTPQVADIPPGEAAEYIADLLGSLHEIAIYAKLGRLCDLISAAEEEAKLRIGR